MGKMTVAGVYGRAIFEVARDGDILEEVKEELNCLKEIFDKETEFFHLLSEGPLTKKEKINWLEEIFKDKVCEKTMSFLCILAEKRRMFAFPAIVEEYNALTEKENLISHGTVFSVIPLSEEEIEYMEKETEKLLKKKKVKLENVIDKKILGGFAIQVDGNFIDASVKKRMQDLTLAVKKAE